MTDAQKHLNNISANFKFLDLLTSHNQIAAASEDSSLASTSSDEEKKKKPESKGTCKREYGRVVWERKHKKEKVHKKVVWIVEQFRLEKH